MENIKNLEKRIAPDISTQEQTGQIYILQFKFKSNSNRYFLADLKGTLSNNIKDSLIIIDYDIASRVGGIIEKIFEEEMNIVTSCKIIKSPISVLLESIII